MNTIAELLQNNICKDYYKEILDWQAQNPYVCMYVWGTGSVATGVAKECLKRNIRIDGFFVNVENYNLDSRIREMKLPIYQLSELLKRKNKFSIIMGHSHYELVTEVEKLDAVENVWRLASVSRDDINISIDFIEANLDKFQSTLDALADDFSKRNMIAYLKAKISNDDSWIINEFKRPCTYFDNDVFKLHESEVYLDIGAYDGKSIDEFVELCPHYEKIIGIEVEPVIYGKLIEKCRNINNIKLINAGVSNHVGTDYFNFDDQSTCLSKNGGVLVDVTTVDEICKDENKITVLKICIGNTVVPLLEGASNIINKYQPKMAIVAGIDSRALIDYLPTIDGISKGGYKYYLRFTNAMAETLVLFAVPTQ